MEEIGKKRLAAAGAVAAGLVYFLVCAFPLQKELVLAPVWTRGIDSAPSPRFAGRDGAGLGGTAGDGSPIPFRLGDRFGYFTPEGRVLFAAAVSYEVAMAPDAFAPYERLSEGFTIRSPGGAELSRVSSVGYPFFAAGRRFVIGPDQATVSELAQNGTVSWTYRFSSVVTAFDACAAVAVFGLVDGSVVGLDGRGAASLDFAPGGSRIAGVYGVAVSPDGFLVAAVTGLDRQRLVVMERRASAYRVAYHRYLASDYRRPVNMAFTADGRRLMFESEAGVGVYDRASRGETIVTVPAPPRLGLTSLGGDLMVLLSGDGERKRLVCAAQPDRRIVDVSLGAGLAYIEASDDSLFLCLDDEIVRMDFLER